MFLRKHFLITIAFLVWMPAIGIGTRTLLLYSNTPGSLATPLERWPDDLVNPAESPRATLVVFAHPQCPCTRATIGELEKVMASCRGKVRGRVYFYAPSSESAGWVRNQLWRNTAEIPDVEVLEDRDGRESRRFGASTSGQVLLYNAAGKLTFNGGITQTRGHAGDNDGEDAIISLLQTGRASRSTSSVFGCSLRLQQGNL